MNQEMTPQEALSIIDQALGSVQADRGTHIAIQKAFETVKAMIEPVAN